MLDPTIVVAVVTTTGTLAGIIASRRVGTGKEKRAELQSSEARKRNAEARARLWEEAADEARQRLRDNGLPVPPVPDGLTKMEEGGQE